MKRVAVIISLMLGSMVLGACGVTVRGNGDIVDHAFDLSNFDSITHSGSPNVVITQGDDFSVVLRADSNLIEYFDLSVTRGTLDIRWVRDRPNVRPTEDIMFIITMPELQSVEHSGSGDTIINDFVAETIDITATGSGDFDFAMLTLETLTIEQTGSGSIEIEMIEANQLNVDKRGSGDVAVDEGRIGTQTISITGSGSYEARDVEGNMADIRISGSGSATVQVTEQLDGTISGSGDINYVDVRGLETNISISGSGESNRLN